MKLLKSFYNKIASNNIPKITKIIYFINFILGVIYLCYLIFTYKFLPTSIFIVCILLFVIYFSLNLYILLKNISLTSASQSLKGEKLVNKSLSILHDNTRAFKHDFNNIVQAIGGYITTEDMDGLKNYYSQLLGDCQKVNNLSTLNPEVINNPAIYSLLTSKYNKADELGIKINLDTFMDLNNLHIKDYELARILGILLDNAIEATMECEEKIINIIMRKDEVHNRNLFIISNTYRDKDINLDKIFEKCYTTKPNNTGLGLWEIRQILKSNNNLNLFTSKDDKYFKQQLEIYF